MKKNKTGPANKKKLFQQICCRKDQPDEKCNVQKLELFKFEIRFLIKKGVETEKRE